MNEPSPEGDESDDYADFTVNSINNLNAGNNDETAGTDKDSTPFSRYLNRAKSTSSFIIHPQRKSSIIVAATGEKIQRAYSTWGQLSTSASSVKPVTDATLLISPEEESVRHERFSTLSSVSRRSSSFTNYMRKLATKPILKAAIAYFLASLTVYSPTISNLLGSSDSKHMVCTVVVYFHASRSVGSMIQALMFVSFSLLFGIGVSVTTLSSISLYLDDTSSSMAHLREINMQSPLIISLTLTVCSISLGLISFCKHRVRKQTFNTACSLAAILMISCLIKEYSKILDSDPTNIVIPWSKIISSISCVICGCCISVFVCFTIWKNWAETELIAANNSVKTSIGDTLVLLCDVFTSSDCTSSDIESDREKISKSFKDLKGKRGKLDSSLEETMYECLIYGREKEFTLYKDLVESEKKLIAYLGGLRRAVEFKWEMIEYYETMRGGPIDDPFKSDASMGNLDVLNENDEDTENSIDPLSADTDLVKNPEELIELFLYHLAPSTKSFVFTMNQILRGSLYDSKINVDPLVKQYSKSLALAHELFETHQKRAIDSVYKQDIFTKNDGLDEKVNQEEVAATCANFSFSITEFSLELAKLLNIMTSLLDSSDDIERSYNFLKFWHRGKKSLIDTERNQLVNADLDQLENETVGYKFWKITKFTRGVDFQFGFRVGLGALILGSLAFWDATRHIFKEWRGEWILVTYCIIMNKSLGGTTMTLKWRFLGTFVGAVTAFTVWSLFYPNVILMAILGFFVSLPCFDIILNWKANNAFGRFILLTYNLTVLYSYTMSLNDISDGDDWEGGGNPIIWEIAFHRYIGVSLGVVWAIVITLTLFPVTARSRIKRGLSILWLRMGIIWKRGALYKRRDEYGQDTLDGLRGLKDCHSIMNELRILLKQAPMEIRLKGPFPIEIYTRLMDGTEGILDAYENINSIVDIDPVLNPVESLVLENVREEMSELQNRVFLIFYMLASALKLGIPLASDPATTEHTMVKLLSKLGDVRRTVEARREIGKYTGLKNTDFVLLYSYCLVTNSVVNELTKLMNEVVNLYGKLDSETLELT